MTIINPASLSIELEFLMAVINLATIVCYHPVQETRTLASPLG